MDACENPLVEQAPARSPWRVRIQAVMRELP
jgi:hypothetical protein